MALAPCEVVEKVEMMKDNSNESIHESDRFKKRSVVVHFGGGLGNQLFNYATGLHLARKTGRHLVKDPSEYLMIWNRRYDLDAFDGPAKTPRRGPFMTCVFLAWRVMQQLRFSGAAGFLHLFGVEWRHSPGVGIDAEFAKTVNGEFSKSSRRTLLLSGCSQDLRSLVSREEARKVFSPVKPVDFNPGPQSVSLHVRRGDYLDCKWALGDEYYRNAVRRMQGFVKNPKWFVFSDDIEWCRTVYGEIGDVEFVEGDVEHPWKDLVKMSRCQHHIIANSTFSWWAAYLSDKGGLTIYPDPWLKGVPSVKGVLVPEDWLPCNY